MIRLSNSFELGACANVRPVSTVSATSGNEVETPLTVELAAFPVCVCLSMNVKLKFSSSSLDRRKRKVGAAAEEERSGSWVVKQEISILSF